VNVEKIIIRTITYTIFTFAIAASSHGLLSANRIQSFGYFESEHGFTAGILTILIQEVILSILFPID